MGDQAALKYLVEMLDDPDSTGKNFHTPGQGIRAAQALCDIFDWPFERGLAAVASTKALVTTHRVGQSEP
jgi:hypothetical protein